jgi:outer membrane protein assembly factor BamA
VPLTEKLKVGAEAAVGTSTGTVPLQRWFFLGGANTLRGYEPSTARGTSMVRGRLELARTYSFGSLVAFTDWGWAGDRDSIRRIDSRWAIGAGTSLLDGVLRIDLAHALRAPRGWRIDMHLDAIM